MTRTWAPPGPALLFCPADRPDRYAKAAATADVVILDLEDGVAPGDKGPARRALAQTLLDPARTIVRVNPAGTDEHALDLAALADTPYDVIMLAKTEAVDQVAALGSRRVVALCETPTGVLAAAAIAACPQTVGLMWGAEDLLAALGGRSSRYPEGRYRDVARYARSHVLLVAGAHALPAIDAVHLDIGDLEGLGQEAADAAASGFAASACIHPTHVAVIRSAYRPSDEEITWARAVLAAAATREGAFALNGSMVDAPVLRHAQQILGPAGH